MPEHLEGWWGYGTLFLGGAIAQGLFSAALLRWLHMSLLLLLGIECNLLIVALYFVTRTVGVPVFGPDAVEVEEVGLTDLCATMSELAIVDRTRARCSAVAGPSLSKKEPDSAHSSDCYLISRAPAASATLCILGPYPGS